MNTRPKYFLLVVWVNKGHCDCGSLHESASDGHSLNESPGNKKIKAIVAISMKVPAIKKLKRQFSQSGPQ